MTSLCFCTYIIPYREQPVKCFNAEIEKNFFGIECGGEKRRIYVRKGAVRAIEKRLTHSEPFRINLYNIDIFFVCNTDTVVHGNQRVNYEVVSLQVSLSLHFLKSVLLYR